MVRNSQEIPPLLLEKTTNLKQETNNLLNAAVEDTLQEDSLGLLAAHVSVGSLGGHEHATNLALLSVHPVHLELNLATKHIEHLVVLLEELSITLHTRLLAGKGHSHIVTGGHTTALGVKEQTGSVRRHGELATHLEARGDLVTAGGSGGNQLLDGEEERNALSTRLLDGGGGVINTILLGEDDLAILVRDGTRDTIQGVGLTSHQLGVHESLLDGTRLGNLLLLHLEGLGLDAQINKLLLAADGDGVSANHLRASVGQTSTLNLEVIERVALSLGDGEGRHGGKSSTGGQSSGSNLLAVHHGGNIALGLEGDHSAHHKADEDSNELHFLDNSRRNQQ
mmetsp:Transcript_25488/g.35239  ORF Transcript_25488/g.35239 Transcript_25488/m.35239 type:complete len:338 (+) Transcript_25488:297-1310(+)